MLTSVRTLLAAHAPRSERALLVLIGGGFWMASGLSIEALSFVPGLAPSHAMAWRFGLGLPSVVIVIAIFRLGPRLSPRGFRRGEFLVGTLVLAVNLIVLSITPATFAVLVNLTSIVLAFSYGLRPHAVLLGVVAVTALALTPLFLNLPGDARSGAPAWLLLYLPTMWAIGAVVAVRRAAVNRARDEAREQALTDPLTGLGNLRRLRAAADQDARQPGEAAGGLLLIDLDNFKAANTLHGHPGGDHALRTVAGALRQVARSDHTVARIGGDEIAVLAPHASPAELEAYAVMYRDAVRAANTRLDLPGVRLDASVGVARRPVDGTTLTDLLTAADRAMYAVKATRPDRRRAPAPRRVAAPAEAPADVAAGRRLGERAASTEADSGPAAGASAEPTRWRAATRARLTALFVAVTSAAVLLSLALPGGHGAHVAATAALCAIGVALAAAIALGAPSARTLSHPAVDIVCACAVAALMALTGGVDSQALPLVFLVVLLQATATPPRPLVWRLVLPAAVVLSPLAYQDAVSGSHGATRLALLAACIAISWVFTLAMQGSERVLERLKEASRRHAATDPLTGLANRREFERRLALALTRDSPQLAVVMIDLDNFGDVNTTHGHRAGDALLYQIAGALRGAAREQDCVARIGGDEFAAIVPGAGALTAQTLAERFVEAVSECTSLSDDLTRASVSASAGFAVCPLHAGTLEELVARADDALMEVKSSGKGSARASAVIAAG